MAGSWAIGTGNLQTSSGFWEVIANPMNVNQALNCGEPWLKASPME